ncbi:hypothetical protein FQN50_005817 [Emmonsiellopsis sp. PD_5]|nr:hypothetical protein FQN50_005817 [Emmonsiellopsis sp. PD_5]
MSLPESYESRRSTSTELGRYSVYHEAMEAREERNQQPEWKPQRQEWLIILCIFMLYLMIALDSTIIVPVLPTIASDLKGTAIETFWAGTSFLLTYAIFQPFIAVISDVFGRREVLLASVSFFTLGTLVASVAKNFAALLAGRTIQGIGAGGVYVLGYIIISDIVPLRQRPKFISIVQVAWAIGTILGPLIGGLFAEHTTWRWTFYINFPFCAIGFVIVPVAVKIKKEEASFMSKINQVDWIGGSLFIGSTTLFLMAISWGGTQFAWGHIATFAPLMIGIVGISYTLWFEFRVAKVPFLRKSLFYCRSAIIAYICTFLQGLELYVILYYIPLYFQSVKAKAAVDTAVRLFPFSVAFIPASVVVAALIGRLGRYRWSIWTGWVLTTLSTGLLLIFKEDTKTPVWAVIMILLGFGHGFLLSALNLAVQAIATSNNSAHAVMMYSFLRAVGASVGVGMGGTIFQNVMSHKLDSLGLPTEIAKNAEGYIEVLHGLPVDSPMRIGVIESYVKGIQGVFAVMTALSALAMFLSPLIGSYSLNKDFEPAHSRINSTDSIPDRPKSEVPILMSSPQPATTYSSRDSANSNYLGPLPFEDYRYDPPPPRDTTRPPSVGTLPFEGYSYEAAIPHSILDAAYFAPQTLRSGYDSRPYRSSDYDRL